jgi:hypothetical protein
MNRDLMLKQYRVLRELTTDHKGWLRHPYGIDLWVDGLNVFLTIGEEHFLQMLDRFLEEHAAATTSKMGCLRALQTFCQAAAKAGEFELYQALSVGMTWLSLHMELKNPFFNLPLEITDHSTALLLSPTYLAMWAHSYNAGITLYTDLNTDRIALFRPEHGRVCESGKPHQQHTRNFLYTSYFHEMAHIYFFHDLYSRVIGSAAEDASYMVHVEGICSVMCDTILAELISVRDDLTAQEDGFNALLNNDLTPGDDLLAVHRGQRPGMTPRALSLYTIQSMQQGKDEFFIPENRVQQTIIERFAVSEAEVELIRTTRYGYYSEWLQSHARWGKAASIRNRIPAFRETVELLPADPYCLQKLEESMHPDAWPTLERMFSRDPFPEPNPTVRQKNLELWDWRELFFRLAETRGYLQTEGDAGSEQDRQSVLDRLLKMAANVAAMILEHDEHKVPIAERHEQLKAEIKQEIREVLFGLPDGEMREKTLEMFGGNPYAYVLEPH